MSVSTYFSRICFKLHAVKKPVMTVYIITTQFETFSHISLTMFFSKTLPSFAGNGTNLSFLVKVKCCKIIFKKRTKNRTIIGELTVCLLQVKTKNNRILVKFK